MNASAKDTIKWCVLGFLSHLALLLCLVSAMLSLPDSWRGRILVEGYREGQFGGTRSIRDHDALLLGLVALASVVVSLMVMWLGWNRRRWFAVGFLVPAFWGIFHLLK
jgi:hypothetical protein